jgi:N-methylhydantoinase A
MRLSGQPTGSQISVDVGGTFTDVVFTDGGGRMTIGKALTTARRASEGIVQALEVVAEEIGADVDDLLAGAHSLLYGTTRATNAVVEGDGARTAFFTTRGFPDILTLREGGKLQPFNYGMPYPAPYVPRHLTFEITERVGPEGQLIAGLDERSVLTAIDAARRAGAEAIAVCLLWSVVNPDHERRIGALIEEHAPGLPFTLSHELNPVIREYRRASSGAFDASLKPLMQEHLTTMAHDLREAGLGGELLVAVSVGGVMHVDDVIERPIYLVRSGPSLAPVAGRAYASEEGFAEGSVIVCDTGGTSFDVSLVRGSDLVATREAWLGPRFTGHLTGLSAVDVRSIGAGGGSIAWVDDGGLLRVGPQSAGSNPGPAAYRLGGREPTVTDAAAVLGYLDPDFFLGGRIVLDVDAARAAIEPVAAALGIGSDRCASAILAVANEQMIAAIKEITVNEGIDPRDSLIVAGGGAGGLNVVPIAAGLGCRRVLVPRTAGALSSCGAQFSDVVAEFTVTEFTTSGAFDVDAVNAALARVDAEIEAFGRGLRARGLTDQSTS